MLLTGGYISQAFFVARSVGICAHGFRLGRERGGGFAHEGRGARGTPQVRRHTAERWYVQLLALEAVPPLSADATEQLRETLSTSSWDGPREAMQESLEEVYSAFGLECPALPGKGARGAGLSVQVRAGHNDGTYGSLVLDAARS